jgi:hypothetical protein
MMFSPSLQTENAALGPAFPYPTKIVSFCPV